MVKVNNFDSSRVLPPGSGQIDRFLTNFINVGKGVIKVDKRKILILYFKHICILLLLSVFPGKLLLCNKSEQVFVISIIWPLDKAQFHMFMTYAIKVDKRKELRLNFERYFKHTCFQENYPDAVKVNKSNFPGKTESNKSTQICLNYSVSISPLSTLMTPLYTLMKYVKKISNWPGPGGQR